MAVLGLLGGFGPGQGGGCCALEGPWGSTPSSSRSSGAGDARQPLGWGSAPSALGVPCLGCPCRGVPAMAGLGTATPCAKRPRRESSGDLQLSATKAGARRRARSRQGAGDRGEHCPPWDWDPWARVPCSPGTPGKGRLAKLRLEGEQRRLASASPCPKERGERPPPGNPCLGKGGLPQAVLMGPLCPTEPASPPLQPCYKGAYFSGLPTDECQDQDPAVPSL